LIYTRFLFVNNACFVFLHFKDIPNSGRGLDRLGFRVEWEKAFRNYLSKLEAVKPIIWTGDLNVAHNPIDLKNPDTNHKTAGFTKEERQCFTDLLTDGYFDSFRHLYPDQKGAYTCWSYLRNSRASNVGWRLDYFVLSEKLKEYLTDNVIRSKVTGSDHCPIACFLKF
jgi:exodeoxyribonuclease III